MSRTSEEIERDIYNAKIFMNLIKDEALIDIYEKRINSLEKELEDIQKPVG